MDPAGILEDMAVSTICGVAEPLLDLLDQLPGEPLGDAQICLTATSE
jgi:hypothetical protein